MAWGGRHCPRACCPSAGGSWPCPWGSDHRKLYPCQLGSGWNLCYDPVKGPPETTTGGLEKQQACCTASSVAGIPGTGQTVTSSPHGLSQSPRPSYLERFASMGSAFRGRRTQSHRPDLARYEFRHTNTLLVTCFTAMSAE